MSANYLGYLAAILYLLSALSILQKQLTENKKGLISKLMQRDKNLQQRAARYWSDLEMDIESFDGKERLGAAISDLTKKDILSFFDEILQKTGSQYVLISSDGKFGTKKT